MAKGGASASSAPAACDSAMWSPCSDCSSEENNSPTALNSFFWDKPALEDKALEFGLPHSRGAEFEGAPNRPLSNGYVNLKSGFGNENQERDNRRVPHKEQQALQYCGLDPGNSVAEVRTKDSNLVPTQRSPSRSPTQRDRELFLTSPPTPVESKELLIAKLREEQESLKKVPWFQAGIPREIALEVLSEKPVGSFIVRDSTTKLGCYALSLRVPPGKNPSGIAHYLILHTNRGYKIKGFTKEFGTLDALITHHSVMPELLPCPLDLPRPYKDKSQRREDDMDLIDDDQSDKRSLFSDIHWIMNDLEL